MTDPPSHGPRLGRPARFVRLYIGEIVNVVKANATAERGEDPEEVEATATVTTEDNL